MPYERSQALENRLQQLLALLRAEKPSAQALVRELKISQPTLSRCLTALRTRGYIIRAVKDKGGWSYRLASNDAPSPSRSARSS